MLRLAQHDTLDSPNRANPPLIPPYEGRELSISVHLCLSVAKKVQWWSGHAFDNQYGIDAEHAEGVVHDVIYRGEFFCCVGDEVI